MTKDQWLPRGPHDLTREQVEASQRRRLIAAMTSAVGELGFVRTSVAEVLQRAGVSRTTFYVFFKDKEDCFIAAFDAAVEEIGAAMMASLLESDDLEENTDLLQKVDILLGIYLHVLSTYPEAAKTFLVEIYAVGQVAVARRRDSMDKFLSLVIGSLFEGFELTEERTQVIQALVHAMSSMVTLAVGSGNHEEIPQLREPLMALIRPLVASGIFGPARAD